eukprot:1130636-Amphidinium_carterae.1
MALISPAGRAGVRAGAFAGAGTAKVSPGCFAVVDLWRVTLVWLVAQRKLVEDAGETRKHSVYFAKARSG